MFSLQSPFSTNPAGGRDATGPIRILTVCTGNICRSPYAAFTLGAALESARPGAFLVESAGTHALAGQPLAAGTARLLGAAGLAPETFRARLLTASVVGGADIVLAMTDQHREVVHDEAPAAYARTWTIREFAHLLGVIGEKADWGSLLAEAGAGPDPGSRWRSLPGIIRIRGRGIRRRRRDQWVLDPVGRPDEAFVAMADELDPAVHTIVQWERSFLRG